MTITAALVLYSVFWFLTFYIVLQVRARPQDEVGGEVVPGSPVSAPAFEDVGRSARITTLIATLLWALAAGIIVSGWITLEDIDFFHMLNFHHLSDQP